MIIAIRPKPPKNLRIINFELLTPENDAGGFCSVNIFTQGCSFREQETHTESAMRDQETWTIIQCVNIVLYRNTIVSHCQLMHRTKLFKQGTPHRTIRSVFPICKKKMLAHTDQKRKYVILTKTLSSNLKQTSIIMVPDHYSMIVILLNSLPFHCTLPLKGQQREMVFLTLSVYPRYRIRIFNY